MGKAAKPSTRLKVVGINEETRRLFVAMLGEIKKCQQALNEFIMTTGLKKEVGPTHRTNNKAMIERTALLDINR